MALITCQECKNQISEFALSCPRCGIQLTPDKEEILKNEPLERGFHESYEVHEVSNSIKGDGFHASFNNSYPQNGRKIKETKCTCRACGNTWHYGKQDVLESVGSSMHNFGKEMMCCTGCAPALFIPDAKVVDLNKCPRCGSKAFYKEEVIHVV